MHLDNDLFQQLPVPAVQWPSVREGRRDGHARVNPAFSRAFRPGALCSPLPHWTDGAHLTRLPSRTGEPRVCRVTLSTLPTGDRLAVVEDVHAYHLDPLTGLPDRRALLLDAAQPTVGLALIDVDRFKQVNDALGHAAGDRVLEALARLLAGAARAGDLHAYRLGGDEFVLCAPHALTGEDLRPLQVGFRETLGRLGIPSGSFSYGLAQAPQHGDTLHALLQHADTQLTRSKRDRRGGLTTQLGRLLGRVTTAEPSGLNNLSAAL